MWRALTAHMSCMLLQIFPKTSSHAPGALRRPYSTRFIRHSLAGSRVGKTLTSTWSEALTGSNASDSKRTAISSHLCLSRSCDCVRTERLETQTAYLLLPRVLLNFAQQWDQHGSALFHQASHPPNGYASKEYRPLRWDQEVLKKNLVQIVKALSPWDLAALVVLIVTGAFLLSVVALVLVAMMMLEGATDVLGQLVPLEEEVRHSWVSCEVVPLWALDVAPDTHPSVQQPGLCSFVCSPQPNHKPRCQTASALRRLRPITRAPVQLSASRNRFVSPETHKSLFHSLLKACPRPDAHVGIQDQAVHRLELCAQSAHWTPQTPNRRFLPMLGKFLCQLPYRWLFISLCDHRLQTQKIQKGRQRECGKMRRWQSNGTFLLHRRETRHFSRTCRWLFVAMRASSLCSSFHQCVSHCAVVCCVPSCGVHLVFLVLQRVLGVDSTVFFLNDKNCYWHSSMFGISCASRFFSDGRMCFRSDFFWALYFHDLFVTRPLLVGLLCYHILTFFSNYEQNICFKMQGVQDVPTGCVRSVSRGKLFITIPDVHLTGYDSK